MENSYDIWAPGLGSKLIVNPGVDTVIAGVTYTDVSQVELGDLMPITIQNTTIGADEIIRIGDPDGVIASTFGISSKGYDVGDYTDAQLASFFRKGAVIRSFNLESTNSDQFAKPFNYYAVELDSSAAAIDIRGSLASSSRATDLTNTIRTLDFGYDSGVLINHSNGLYLTQLGGTTLTLTITLQAILK